jgi:hypothetical protein
VIKAPFRIQTDYVPDINAPSDDGLLLDGYIPSEYIPQGGKWGWWVWCYVQHEDRELRDWEIPSNEDVN